MIIWQVKLLGEDEELIFPLFDRNDVRWINNGVCFGYDGCYNGAIKGIIQI
jgi:hypothetical protein